MSKLSRNAPCPCGSGKKLKRCCWGIPDELIGSAPPGPMPDLEARRAQVDAIMQSEGYTAEVAQRARAMERSLRAPARSSHPRPRRLAGALVLGLLSLGLDSAGREC